MPTKKKSPKVKKVMKEFKKGKLTIGKSKKKVQSKKQAVAIALDQARKSGEKVTPKPATRKKTTKKTAPKTKRPAKKSTSKKK